MRLGLWAGAALEGGALRWGWIQPKKNGNDNVGTSPSKAHNMLKEGGNGVKNPRPVTAWKKISFFGHIPKKKPMIRRKLCSLRVLPVEPVIPGRWDSLREGGGAKKGPRPTGPGPGDRPGEGARTPRRRLSG